MTRSPALARPCRTIPQVMADQLRTARARGDTESAGRVLIERGWHPDTIAAQIAEAERLAELD